MQDNIESDFLQSVANRLGRVEDRVIPEPFFITTEDGFLIDDFQVTCLQIGCEVTVEKRIVMTAVRLQAGLPNCSMDQIIADCHQRYFFRGKGSFCDCIRSVCSLNRCFGIFCRGRNRWCFLRLFSFRYPAFDSKTIQNQQ